MANLSILLLTKCLVKFIIDLLSVNSYWHNIRF